MAPFSKSLPPCHEPSRQDGPGSGLHRSGSPDPSASRHDWLLLHSTKKPSFPKVRKDLYVICCERICAARDKGHSNATSTPVWSAILRRMSRMIPTEPGCAAGAVLDGGD